MQLREIAGVTRANAYLIPPEELHEGAHSRRWADQDVLELALDILERGQLVPVLIAWEKTDGQERLVVVEGHRRVAAIRYINENALSVDGPLKVRCEHFRGPERFAASVAANLKRKGLSPIDLAHSISTLEKEGKTRKDIAKLLEISEALISRSLRLLTLPAGLQKDIHKGKLSAEAGYELAGMEPADRDKAMAEAQKPSASGSAAGAAGSATASGSGKGRQPSGVRAAARKVKREKAERGEATSGPKSRSRKEIRNLFVAWAECEDGTIEEGVLKFAATMVKYMDGEVGDRAVLNWLRELAEEG